MKDKLYNKRQKKVSSIRRKLFLTSFFFIVLFFAFKFSKKIDFNSDYEVGEAIDSLNHVIVYYNGGVSNVEERNTVDGYNIGLEYQCVEFVKRYYFEHYNHRMPDTYGNAKDFFDKTLADGEMNLQRDLIQYRNPSQSMPEVGDLLVMSPTLFNQYGHVAIIASVGENTIEIIQQNPGPFAPSREKIDLIQTEDAKWEIDNDRIVGWLRMQ